MSDRERALRLVYEVPEEKLLYLIAYLEGLSVPDGRSGRSDEDDPFYSAENMERLGKAAERMDVGGGQVHELIEDRSDD